MWYILSVVAIFSKLQIGAHGVMSIIHLEGQENILEWVVQSQGNFLCVPKKAVQSHG